MTLFGQGVFDTRRDFGIRLALDDELILEFLEAFRERAWADTQCLLEGGEALRTAEEFLKNQERPLASDDAQRGFDMILVSFHGLNVAMRL